MAARSARPVGSRSSAVPPALPRVLLALPAHRALRAPRIARCALQGPTPLRDRLPAHPALQAPRALWKVPFRQCRAVAVWRARSPLRLVRPSAQTALRVCSARGWALSAAIHARSARTRTRLALAPPLSACPAQLAQRRHLERLPASNHAFRAARALTWHLMAPEPVCVALRGPLSRSAAASASRAASRVPLGRLRRNRALRSAFRAKLVPSQTLAARSGAAGAQLGRRRSRSVLRAPASASPAPSEPSPSTTRPGSAPGALPVRSSPTTLRRACRAVPFASRVRSTTPRVKWVRSHAAPVPQARLQRNLARSGAVCAPVVRSRR